MKLKNIIELIEDVFDEYSGYGSWESEEVHSVDLKIRADEDGIDLQMESTSDKGTHWFKKSTSVTSIESKSPRLIWTKGKKPQTLDDFVRWSFDNGFFIETNTLSGPILRHPNKEENFIVDTERKMVYGESKAPSHVDRKYYTWTDFVEMVEEDSSFEA